MFMASQDMFPAKLEAEFSKPVESIMRCEDFKSNFARRLSSRFTSRAGAAPALAPARPDAALKLPPPDTTDGNVSDTAPERIELSSQLSKNTNMEQSGEAVKPPDKPSMKNSDIRRTALNMEVETLRWQLAQTEANRQMHIALLKQLVAFLNKVKDHIEYQNNGNSLRKESLPTRLFPRSFNTADLPRSHSVVHVNRNLEYTLQTPKKISTRKISKSIINVNGFKDCNDIWSQPKLTKTPDTENSKKLSEEMSRLITLANTVLSTKIPDLTCNESNMTENPNPNIAEIKVAGPALTHHGSQSSVDKAQDFYKESNENEHLCKDNNNVIKINDENYDNFCENNYSEIKLPIRDVETVLQDEPGFACPTLKSYVDRKNDFNSSFIEDESGFSSMSSFQEIGIPIISIIPPSPCKEIGFMEEIDTGFEGEEKWKTDDMELEKQTVKVFWV